MIQIGAVGGEIWRIGSVKWGSRRGQLDIFTDNIKAQMLSAAQSKGYLWVLSLIVTSPVHHTQFTFQKYPHWGPPFTPSAI